MPLTRGGVTRYRLLLTQINICDRSLPIQLITLHQLFHGGCKVREHSGVLHVRLGTDPPSYAGTQCQNWTGQRCAGWLDMDFCTLKFRLYLTFRNCWKLSNRCLWASPPVTFPYATVVSPSAITALCSRTNTMGDQSPKSLWRLPDISAESCPTSDELMFMDSGPSVSVQSDLKNTLS